jgi:tetratricopeptide (TPR) repeat protein
MMLLSKQSKLVYCSAVIIVTTIAAFSPSIHNGFTNWDDPQYVMENPDIRGFSPDHVVKQFSWITTGNFHPLTMLTYMVDFAISGLHPAGYHLTNLIFHILNSLIVFAFIVALSKNLLVGFLTAMFFAVHPLRVESVAWIAERKDVVSSFFFFLSLWTYVKFREKRKPRFYFGCLVLFVLSLLAKPMAVSLPFVFLLIDYHEENKLNPKAIIEKWPFFAVAVFFSVLAYITQLQCGALSARTVLPFSQRVALPFFGILFYLYKTAVPLHLCAFYPYDYGGFSAHPYAYMMAAIGIGAAAFLLSRHSKKAVFGLLFYTITLLPVLQIVPIGTCIAAERYAYVPMIGIYYLIALGGERLLDGTFVKNRAASMGLTVGLGLIFILLAFLTFNRCEVWKDSISLWSDAISVHPSPLAYDNLGNELQKMGRNDEAAVQYRRALSIAPDDPGALCNLGGLKLDNGKVDDAIALFRKSIACYPGFPDAHINLGNVLMSRGKTDEAVAEYRTALKINPRSAEGLYNFGTALLELGRNEEAIVNLQKALERDPGHTRARLNLGTALLKTGRTAEAIVQYREALERGPDNEEALENLGIAYMSAGRLMDAIACLRQAAAINPLKIAVFNDLGTAFLRNGQVDSALCAARKAMALARTSGQEALAKGIGQKIDEMEQARGDVQGGHGPAGH